MRFHSLLALCLVACEATPSRLPLDTYPSALDESIPEPVGNDCRTRVYAFDLTAAGFLEGKVSGIARFRAQTDVLGEDGPAHRTTVILQVCSNGPTAQVATLAYQGDRPLRRGDYDITTDPEAEGFLFSFADDGDAPFKCTSDTEGSVSIVAVDDDEVQGTFEVTVGCVDETLRDEKEDPRASTFEGSFSAGDASRG